ncbi:hypothetical protein FRB95_008743 [Tulasnella sp. JGI-2019a]|nr:hypothetical protein FRB95_008743 [Tulasnella sp. JGI-2019a]
MVFKGYLAHGRDRREGDAHRLSWLPGQRRSKKEEGTDTESTRFEALLIQALDGMQNLRRLHLCEAGFYGRSLSLLGPVQSIGHFRRAHLTSLSFDGRFCGCGITLPVQLEAHTILASQIYSIIQNQPLLQHLQLPSWFGELVKEPILPKDVPQLISLCASASDARLIIFGRPVATLKLLDPPVDPFLDAWDHLSCSTVPIRDLTFRLPSSRSVPVPVQHLQAIVTHLPRLEPLTVMGVRDVDHSGIVKFVAQLIHL